MPVYDDQKEEKSKKHEGSHDDLGVQPVHREAEVDSLNRLYNAENNPSTPSSKPASTEQENLSDDTTSPWTLSGKLEKRDADSDSGDSRFILKGKITRRRALISGGLATVLIGGGIGLSSFLSGPLQFVQFAKLLERFHMSSNEQVSESRVAKLIRWARTRETPQDRNLSRTGTKIAKHYEKKLAKVGIGLEYNNGRLSEISIDPNTTEGQKFLQSVEAEFDISQNEIPTRDGKKRLVFAADSSEITNTKIRRKLVKSATSAAGMNKVSTAIASRMLKARAAVDFHPLKNLSRSADERARLKYDEYRKRVKEERAKRIQEGAQDSKVASRTSSDDPEKPATEKENADAGKVNEEVEEIKKTAADPDLTPEAKFSGVKGKLTAGVGIAGVVATICGLQSLGEASSDLQESNVVQPLIRTGIDVMATGGQIMSGNDVNFDELGVLSENLYNKEDKTSWMSAESIQTELGKPGTGQRMPDSAKPGKDKPAFFKVVDNFAGPLPCDQINSFWGNIALTVGGVLLTATGPVSFILNAASEGLQNVVANAFIDDLIRWLAGPALEVGGASGAVFGNYANTGAFLASNNLAKGMGGRALTNQERVALNVERIKSEQKDMAKKSFFAKVSDPYEPNSLISRTVIRNESFSNPRGTLASLFHAPLKGFSVFGNLFKSFSPNLLAESQPYDYGVDKFGFSLEELDNTSVENPFENAEYIETKLEELNEKYGIKCFGTTIDPSTGAVQYQKAPRYDQLEKDKGTCGVENKDPDFLKYRFYLVDTISAKTIECYESIREESCTELGLETSSDPNQTTTNSGTVSGDAKTLANTILQNSKITKNGPAKTQLESIASGAGPCPSVNGGQYSINDELLRVIATLGQNYSFTISSLHRGCTNSNVGAGRASRHWQGKAVDITGVNGVSMPSFESYDGSGSVTNFLKQAASILPANCELGVPNSRYQSDVKATNPACQKIFLDTPGTTGATGPHIHIGVP